MKRRKSTKVHSATFKVAVGVGVGVVVAIFVVFTLSCKTSAKKKVRFTHLLGDERQWLVLDCTSISDCNVKRQWLVGT